MLLTIGFVVGIVLGYIAGRLDNVLVELRSPRSALDAKPTSFLNESSKSQVRRPVSIDDSKFVTDVSTHGMTSTGQSLGVVSQTNDDISNAANKLAHLKKTKG